MNAKNAEPGRLAKLIQGRKDLGESLRYMSTRAKKAGHQISHAHIADLMNGDVARAPLPEDIMAIAAALDCSYEQVRQAVIHDWYGYDELRAPDFDALIAPLDGADRDELARMIRAWVSAKQQS